MGLYHNVRHPVRHPARLYGIKAGDRSHAIFASAGQNMQRVGLLAAPRLCVVRSNLRSDAVGRV